MSAPELDEIVAKLREMDKDPYVDPEMSHLDADDLLLRALILLERPDIADAFIQARDHVGFWYA